MELQYSESLQVIKVEKLAIISEKYLFSRLSHHQLFDFSLIQIVQLHLQILMYATVGAKQGNTYTQQYQHYKQNEKQFTIMYCSKRVY